MSLYHLRDFTPDQFHRLCELASRFQEGLWPRGLPPRLLHLVFLEPSTRTLMSFGTAAARLGYIHVPFSGGPTTSQAKGESDAETLATLMAMGPDLLVVRHRGDPGVRSLLQKSKIPHINAGDGSLGHPTQALLDLFTLFKSWGVLKNRKLLLVGDVVGSRVASSHLEIAEALGIQLGIAGPDPLLPSGSEWRNVARFDQLSEGFKWCDAVMGLRLQTERRDESLDTQDYAAHWRIDPRSVEPLSSSSKILHPGPFVEGVDFSGELMKDPRCLVRQQVTSGVFIRAALMAQILEGL